jgi:hypothetical protein
MPSGASLTRTRLLAILENKARLAKKKMSEANQRDDRVETRAYAVELTETRAFMDALKALKSLD